MSGHSGLCRMRSETHTMASWYRALPLVLPLLGAAAAMHAAPVPPASFVSYDDSSPPQAAQPPASPISDHLALNVGFFWGHVDTHGQFNTGQGVPGTPLSAEQTLGLTDQSYQPQFEIIFRLEERNRVRVDFLDLRRNGEVLLTSPIQFGEQTFQANQRLRSMLDWRQMDITYTYSFLRSERFELGAGLGAHLLEAEARAQVPGTPQLADYSDAGPFATLALDGTWLMAKRWSLNARAQYLHLTINQFSGLLEDFHGDLQYRWRRNFALGAGYDYSEHEVDIHNHDPSGIVQLRITGPQLFVRVSY
jgi:hypothetical protein